MEWKTKSPPMPDSGISFVWFNWFKSLWKDLKSFYAEFNGQITTINGTLTSLDSRVDVLEAAPAGGKLKSTLLTTASSSPWTWPSGVDMVLVTMVGGGGGGNGGTTGTGSGGGGGGSGEYCVRVPFAREAASTTSFTVGTGGTGGAASSEVILVVILPLVL